MNTKARKYIPLTEATYYILLSLVKPMHGYGIMQMVEEMTNGEVKLGPGTLYGNTTKLLKEKLMGNLFVMLKDLNQELLMI